MIWAAIQFAAHNVSQSLVRSGVVPVAWAAVCVLVIAGCTQPNNNQQSSSPEASPSTAIVSPSSTPVESPSPDASPSATVSPSPAKLIITSLTFHAAEVGVGYSPVALGAAGGVPPYRWSVSSGTLPTGLALSSGGNVSGTPSAAGAFSFAVRVDDAAGRAAGVGRSITVARHLAVTGLCAIGACAVEQGCVSVCGRFGSQLGGVAPFRYVRTGGTLPPSTSLNGLALAGTFTAVSKLPFSFTVQVTDSLGVTGSIPAAFNVFPHIRFTLTSATCTQTSAACTTRLTYTGGTPNGTPKVKVGPFLDANGKPIGPPPNGFNAVAKGGIVYVSAGGQNYFATVTLILVDQSICGPGPTPCSSNTATVTINL